MGRRKSGRDISGWLLIDKPAGPTSTAVVNKARWALNARKAGHAGTLDPAATGLLAVAFGEATKTVPFVTDALKCYQFRMRFGAATNTDDAEGEATDTSPVRPSDRELTARLGDFIGDIQQVPPKFSAVKIDGERAYAMARQGDDPVLAARPLYVDSLTLTSRQDADTADLELVCGKGGYVRAIARDLGLALGTFGHVLSLRRIWSGDFDVEDAIPMDVLDAEAHQPSLDERLLPLERGLADLPELMCSADAARRLRHGNPAPVLTAAENFGDLAWASHNGEAVAVGQYRAGSLDPDRVFLPRNGDLG